MKFIDLFVASSAGDLYPDLLELGNFIRTLNDKYAKYGIYFRLRLRSELPEALQEQAVTDNARRSPSSTASTTRGSSRSVPATNTASRIATCPIMRACAI
jgi:hypothetical protein